MTGPEFDALRGATPPDDDFRPEDRSASSLPISADFVARTFDRVRADQARIRAEAARVDEVTFPAELLQRFGPPAPSTDFVARTLRAVQDERAAGDAAVRDALARYEAPPTSPEFVERTLAALRVERAPLRRPRAVSGAGRAPLPATRGVDRWTWAAAAAAFLFAFILFATSRGRASGPDAAAFASAPAVASSRDFTPAALTTGWSRIDDEALGGLRLEPVDSLLMLATNDGERRGE